MGRFSFPIFSEKCVYFSTKCDKIVEKEEKENLSIVLKSIIINNKFPIHDINEDRKLRW